MNHNSAKKNQQLNQLIELLNQQRRCETKEVMAQIGVDYSELQDLLEALSSMQYPYQANQSMIEQSSWIDWQFLATTERIRSELGDCSHRINQLSLFSVCASTQNEITELELPDGKVNAILSEYQTQGRGRQGRRWHSPYAAGVCLSLGISVPGQSQLGGSLSLVVAIAVTKAIAKVCHEDVLIKWPNDLVLKDAKLGGILVDSKTVENGTQHVYIGVGINIETPQLGDSDLAAHAMPPIGLYPHIQSPVDRSKLAAGIIEHIIVAIDRFVHEGFEGFLQSWLARDYLMHQHVRVYAGDQISLGVVNGIQNDGALVVTVDGQKNVFYSGEVVVRKF